MLSADDIRKAREKTGESQAKFAERFGVDQSTIHRWETDGPPGRGPAARGIEVVINDIQGVQQTAGAAA